MKRGQVFTFAGTNAPRAGMTISETLFMSPEEHATIFSIAAGTATTALDDAGEKAAQPAQLLIIECADEGLHLGPLRVIERRPAGIRGSHDEGRSDAAGNAGRASSVQEIGRLRC